MSLLSLLGISEKRFLMAGAELGLNVTASRTLEGHWGDIPVSAWHWNKGGDRRYPRTQFVGVLDPPMRMNLNISSRSIYVKFADLFDRRSAVLLGDDTFDKEFNVTGSNEEHIRRLLSSSELTTLLLKTSRSHSRLTLDNRYVTLTDNAHVMIQESIRQKLESIGKLALALRHARRKHKAHWEESLITSWGDVAQRLGLSFDPCRSLMWGEMAGGPISIEVQFDGGLFTQVKAPLSDPLGLSLEIVREKRHMKGRLWKGQDIKVGDPFFDETFVVRGKPEATIRQLLAGEPVDRLKDLVHCADDVQLEGDIILVTAAGPLTDPTAVEHILRTTRQCANAFLSTAPSSNPFR